MKENRHESQLKAIEKDHESQKRLILEYLLLGCPITVEEARQMFGAARASARINELREDGFPIRTKLIPVPGNKKVALYSL